MSFKLIPSGRAPIQWRNVERGMQSAQGHIRKLRLCLPSSYRMIRHSLMDVCRVGDHCRTLSERRHSKRLTKCLSEIGECVMYIRPQSAARSKLDTRWGNCAFAGKSEEFGEPYVMREEGVNEVTSFEKSPEEGRWNHGKFQVARGLP